jgi:hypothetical protein
LILNTFSEESKPIAIKLIKWMNGWFKPYNIIFDNKETVLELNGCRIGFSVIDQGVAYLNLMLIHKTEFLYAYYKRTSKMPEKEAIGWSQPGRRSQRKTRYKWRHNWASLEEYS